MKKLLMAVFALMVLNLTGCGSKSEDKNGNTLADSTRVEGMQGADGTADSTIYGRADGFGQSAFTFIADNGREYDVAFTSGNGELQYGTIIGSRQDTARYAVTLRDQGEALVAMINLSQLDAITTDYEIHNAHLALKDGEKLDPVTVEELSDTLLRATGESGKSYELRRKP